jgi:AcrR family transcriptional regulator
MPTRKAPTRDQRRARTRQELLDAAERRFTRDGFHATAIDAVADDAGYTSGAVYSNFASKEDLFLAVYERRVDSAIPEVQAAIDAADDPARAIERLTLEATARRAHEDGWLAVFFEFWAHALRDPELRARFAAHHARALEPLVAATADAFAQRGAEPYEEPRKLTTAWNAMHLGLLLERLTRPDVVDETLAARMMRRAFAFAG